MLAPEIKYGMRKFQLGTNIRCRFLNRILSSGHGLESDA